MVPQRSVVKGLDVKAATRSHCRSVMQARHREDETPSGASVHGPWVIEKEDAAGERTVWLPEDLQVRGWNIDRTMTNREHNNGLSH